MRGEAFRRSWAESWRGRAILRALPVRSTPASGRRVRWRASQPAGAGSGAARAGFQRLHSEDSSDVPWMVEFMADSMRASVAFGFYWALGGAVNWQIPLVGAGTPGKLKRTAAQERIPGAVGDDDGAVRYPVGTSLRCGLSGYPANAASAINTSSRMTSTMERQSDHGCPSRRRRRRASAASQRRQL